jgi:dTDP-4-amino-4,6-dideoxygalactose transaminase
MNILMSRPSVGKAELDLVDEVFRSGWLGEGRVTETFEKRIAAFTGARHVVAVNTGSSALHLALHALGVGRGDEVILPSMTFASDPMAVLLCGARPVFCDIRADTLNLDPRQIPALLTRRTRVVMPTDFAGLPSDVRAIRHALGGRDIRIVRDASHSFGSMIEGKRVGVFAGEDVTCFSFDPIKNVTCGEGGAILLKDSSLLDTVRSRKILGMVRSTWRSLSTKRVEDRRVVQEGFRYHMSDINAAIGVAQMRRFPGFLRKRQARARLYDRLFASNRNVSVFRRDYRKVAPFMYVIRVAAEVRTGLIDWLAASGIHAGLRYYPCHLQPLFDRRRPRLPVTERLAEEMLSIPLYTDLTARQVRWVVSRIDAFFAEQAGQRA